MEKLRPDIYQKSLKDIHFTHLKDAGIKVILLDMDNTILKYGEKEIERDILNLIDALKSRFTVVLFSNSTPMKVKKFGEELDIPYISFAFKPSKIGFKKVFKRYKVQYEEVAIIGDQLLTDIKGGNKVGITTILIEPLNTEDGIATRINRRREKRILKKMGAAGLFFKERYYE